MLIFSILVQNLLKKDRPIVPTGTIVFMPNDKLSGFEVLEKLNLSKEVDITKTDEYNYVYAIPKDENRIFEIANIIHTSKFAKWGNPDFWSFSSPTTSDPLYNDQYYLQNTGQFGGTSGIDINVNGAWSITNGNSNIRVAVVDEGVENNHEDMGNRVLSGFSPDYPTGFGRPEFSTDKHGQACAGIIAATNNNSIGMAGICPNCNIVPIKIRYGGLTSNADLAASINWAWNQGQADVLSNSYTWSVDNAIDQAVLNARTQGRSNKGCPFVASSGNYTGSVSYPGNISNVITVGAIKNNGQIWGYSNTGPSMDLVAPSSDGNGTDGVRTTDRMGNNGYTSGNYNTSFGGTSAACPQVAGVAALMLSVNPNLTESQVRTILQQTATDMGSVGFDNTFGYGRLNACAAVAFAQVGSFLTMSTGGNSICSGPQNYTVSNIPAGASILWTVNPANTTAVTLTNITSPTVTVTKNANGLVTLIATVTICGTNFQLTKTINVGLPYVLWNPNGCTYPEATYETGQDEGPCNSQCYSPSQNKWWCATPVYNATNVTWQKMYSIPANYSFWSGSWSGNNNYVNILFKSPNQYVELKTTISNPCGSIVQYYCFNSTNILCSGNLKSSECQLFSASLNPANKQLQIRKNNNSNCTYESADLQIKTIQIVDKVGNIIKEQKLNNDRSESFDFNLSSLKNDVYFILIQYNDSVETHQIAIFR